MAFSNVHYVSIYQTVTSLTYVFVLLAFRPRVRDVFIPGLIIFILKCQCTIENETTSSGKEPHLTLLLTTGS